MIYFKLDKKKFDKVSTLFGEYVDIVYLNGRVILASEDGICYCHLICEAYAEDVNQERFGFRVETSILKRLLLDGKVGIRESSPNIELSMYGDSEEVIYTSYTPMMNSFIDFKEVQHIISEFKEYDYKYVVEENTVIKLSSKLNQVFVSEGEYCYVFCNNSYLFAKSDLGHFCVDGKYFKNITSIFNRFKLIDNYLVFLEGDTLITLRKNRMPLDSDLKYIMNSKAICKFSVDFKRANYLVNSLGSENYIAKLDFNAGKLIVNSYKGIFEAKVKSDREKIQLSIEEKIALMKSPNSSVNSSSKSSSKIINIPKWVFSVISDYSNLTFYIKKSSCLIRFGNSIVIFPGGFINEK